MPLLWLSIAFVTGIFVAGTFHLTLSSLLAIIGIAFLSIFIAWRFLRRAQWWSKIFTITLVHPSLLLILLALGGIRYQTRQLVVSENALAFYNDRGTFTITGRISTPPDQREDAVYIDLNAIEIEDPLATNPALVTHAVKGIVRVRFSAGANYRIGDVMRITGNPQTPSTDEYFSYKDYLARQQIYTVLYYPRQVQVVDHVTAGGFQGWLEARRQAARRVIFSLYPQPESGLLSGILLGLDRDIPRSLTRAYQHTGTAHIIAISGFNMSILALVFSRIFARFLNRYWAALLSGVVILTYTIFVGATPSVVRAAIMAMTAFGGHLIGRRQAGSNALGITAACMCLVNPLLLWDVSFQLSFAATLGLVLFAEPLRGWLDSRAPGEKIKPVLKPVYQYFLLTLAAQLLTLPLIAHHFGRVSLSSLLANPIILPVQPPLLVLGGLSLITGSLYPFLGRVFSFITWPLAAYSNLVVTKLSGWQFGSLVVNAQSALWIFTFIILFILLFVFRNFFKKLFRGWYYWILFFLLLAVFSTWSLFSHQPDGRLHLHLLPAGEESLLFLRTPAGQTLLFDPGAEVNEMSAAIGDMLSPWSYRVDAVWLSDRSYARNLSELDERLPLRSIVLPPVVYRAGADTRPLEIPPHLALEKLQPGSVVDYDPGLQLCVVAENYDSAAFLVTYGNVKILIPNGVDYALIQSADPAVLSNLAVLILTDADISYIPPRVWQQLSPHLVLWNSPSVTPVDTWLGPREEGGIHIISDGTDLFQPSRP